MRTIVVDKRLRVWTLKPDDAGVVLALSYVEELQQRLTDVAGLTCIVAVPRGCDERTVKIRCRRVIPEPLRYDPGDEIEIEARLGEYLP